jgi:hypothetical protein
MEELSDQEIDQISKALTTVWTSAANASADIKITPPGFCMLLVKMFIVFNLVNDHVEPHDIHVVVKDAIDQANEQRAYLKANTTKH